MSCSKINFLQLTLFLALALLSCQKENPVEFKEDSISPPEEIPISEINIQTTKNLTAVSISNQEIVINAEEAIREIVFKSLVQTIFYPQIYGFTGSSASTRTGCPNSTLTTESGPSGSIYTLILDYGIGCTSGGNAEYEGIITLVINGEINSNETEVNLQLSDDFKINSNNDIDGSMSFSYNDEGFEQMYLIDDISLQNTNILNSEITQISLSTAKVSRFILKPNTTNDPGNAMDILNDTIAYAGCFKVVCPNAEILRSCTILDIDYSIPCGVPFDGEIMLDTLNADGTYGSVNATIGTFGNMNYAYPNTVGFGQCDELIEFIDNNNVSTIIQL